MASTNVDDGGGGLINAIHAIPATAFSRNVTQIISDFWKSSRAHFLTGTLAGAVHAECF